MKKIKFYGNQIPSTSVPDLQGIEELEAVEIYQLNTATRAERAAIELDGEDKLIELVFEDGTEWLTDANEIEKLFPNPSKRGEENTIEIPDFLTFETPDQRGIKKFFLKLVKLYQLKQKKLTKKLGIQIDQKIKAKEILYRLHTPSHYEEFKANPSTNPDKYLLLLHGFGSSTRGSFFEPYDDSQFQTLWSKMRSIYQEAILGYDHHTISKSPIQNAIDVIQLLPQTATLDILSYSRGGLIADLLAKCSVKGTSSNRLFSQEDYKKLDEKQQEELKTLEELAKEKKIKVNRVIRVACPARGTILLDQRMDYFLNAVLGGFQAATGIGFNPIYWAIKGLLVQTIKARTKPEIFPGVAAMVPGSDFQQMINQSKRKTKDELLVIEGDAQYGYNIKQSLLVLLANIGFSQKNDFVVNTN
ncbi:MAG: hypothetical protein AAF242_21160, partial [Bacteroidota bacterium]